MAEEAADGACLNPHWSERSRQTGAPGLWDGWGPRGGGRGRVCTHQAHYPMPCDSLLATAPQRHAGDNRVRVEHVLAMRWATDLGQAPPTGWLLDRPVEFLVKYVNRAHVHSEWLTEHAALSLACRKVTNAVNKAERRPFNIADPRNWEPQRVVAHRKGVDGRDEYLIKWDGIGIGLGYELATWEAIHGQDGVPHPLAQHTGLKALIQAMQEREYEAVNRASHRQRGERHSRAGAFAALTAQPDWLPGGPPAAEGVALPQLMPHQLEALNFLRSAYLQEHGVILADDMGLGKTISALAYLRSLRAEFKAERPSLVVAPLCTLPNWATEAKGWAPTTNVVIVHGTPAARQVITDYELWQNVGNSRKRVSKPDIVLTNYETVQNDQALFRSIEWESLVLDEGHRVKAGPKAKVFDALTALKCRHKVLLTGTPVQNSLEELFHLLHFLNPATFPSFDAFTASVDATAAAQAVEGGVEAHAAGVGITPAARAAALISVAAPHMLRRLKRDVLTNLPPRREVHVPVDLTPVQTQWYRKLLMRNHNVLAGRNGNKTVQAQGLRNVVMELRKVCNHPCLVDPVNDLSWSINGGDDAAAQHFNSPMLGSDGFGAAHNLGSPTVNPSSSNDTTSSGGHHAMPPFLYGTPSPPHVEAAASGVRSARLAALVASCGKLALLDVMLPALQQRGHRVLIFSQFQKTLDVLEEYVRLRFGRTTYERVDGTMQVGLRQAAIGRFNAEGSSRFVFLLSTRACGLGINLATADTVIIYDSDWNPHQDVQAMSRAHRIGQTRSVAVFRLFTRYTVEERILEFAKRKMALDNIFKGQQRSTEARRLLQDVLRWGADRLFTEDDEDAVGEADLATALPEPGGRHAVPPGSATADLVARYDQGNAVPSNAAGGERSRGRIQYSQADVGTLLDNARATLHEDGDDGGMVGIPAMVAPPPPCGLADAGAPSSGGMAPFGFLSGPDALPRVGDDDDLGLDLGVSLWTFDDPLGDDNAGGMFPSGMGLSPGRAPDFEDALLGDDEEMRCFVQSEFGYDQHIDTPPGSGGNNPGEDGGEDGGDEGPDGFLLTPAFWDNLMAKPCEAMEAAETAQRELGVDGPLPAEYHTTGVGGRVKMRGRKRPSEAYVVSLHQQAEAELDAAAHHRGGARQNRRGAVVGIPPVHGGGGATVSGAWAFPLAPSDEDPSSGAPVSRSEQQQQQQQQRGMATTRRARASPGVLRGQRKDVDSILQTLRLPPALAAWVLHLGQFLVFAEPAASASRTTQLAVPTLVALTLVAADATGTVVDASLRSPVALGQLFGLMPETVESYCAAVSTRVHPYLIYMAAGHGRGTPNTV